MNQWEMNSFSDKQKVREFNTTKPALQQILQGLLQPRLLRLARLLFRFDGEIKSFQNKQKLREFNTTKPALQQMLKERL